MSLYPFLPVLTSCVFYEGNSWVVYDPNNVFPAHPPVHSLERLESYLQLDQEARLNDGRIPPAHWPSSGELRVENLSAKYAPDGPEVLHELSFHIKSGERIGVGKRLFSIHDFPDSSSIATSWSHWVRKGLSILHTTVDQGCHSF